MISPFHPTSTMQTLRVPLLTRAAAVFVGVADAARRKPVETLISAFGLVLFEEELNRGSLGNGSWFQ